MCVSGEVWCVCVCVCVCVNTPSRGTMCVRGRECVCVWCVVCGVGVLIHHVLHMNTS